MIRRVLAFLLAVAVAACQSPAASVEVTDPRVSVGAERSCSEMGISDVRCTFLILRATKQLELSHPDAVVTGRELHEVGAPPAGQSPLPASQIVAMVVVFQLQGGSRVGVPLLCPRESGGADPACNPRVE